MLKANISQIDLKYIYIYTNTSAVSCDVILWKLGVVLPPAF